MLLGLSSFSFYIVGTKLYQSNCLCDGLNKVKRMQNQQIWSAHKLYCEFIPIYIKIILKVIFQLNNCEIFAF